MTSMSDRPFQEAARLSLLAAAERLEKLGTLNIRRRLSADHVVTYSRIVEAPVSWIGGIRADQLAAYLRDEAAREGILADVLNLAAAASPEDE